MSKQRQPRNRSQGSSNPATPTTPSTLQPSLSTISSTSVSPLATTPLTEVEQALLTTQYSVLRDETIAHTANRVQILSIHFVSIGAILTIGMQQQSPAILLILPILGVLLANQWTTSYSVIFMIGHYVRTQIEPYANGSFKMWETILADKKGLGKLWDGIDFMSFLIFFTPQLISIYLAYELYHSPPPPIQNQIKIPGETLLFIVAFFCMVLTIVFFVANWIHIKKLRNNSQKKTTKTLRDWLWS